MAPCAALITELISHVREGVREEVSKRFASIERLETDDIAEVITFLVTRPRRMAINDVLVRPTAREL